MEQNWPFEDTPNVAVITVKQILEGVSPILYVTYDEDDGSWQFLTGDYISESDARVVALRTVFQIDRSIADIADLPLGWTASRKSVGSDWIRTKRKTST